jgi:hypothetical protein
VRFFSKNFTPTSYVCCKIFEEKSLQNLNKSPIFSFAKTYSSTYALSTACGDAAEFNYLILNKNNEKKGEKGKKQPPYSGNELGNDPTKPPSEGFKWKGKGQPGSKEGNWHNPNTNESIHPDLGHDLPIKPHWDYVGPDFPKGVRLNVDGSWEQKR